MSKSNLVFIKLIYNRYVLIEALYLFFLLLIALVGVTITQNGLILALLIILALPLLSTLLSLYSAPYIPSNRQKKETMIRLADIKPGDLVYDLGAGDGRLLLEAEKLGAQAIGYEISFPLIVAFWLRTVTTKSKVQLKWADFWHKDFSAGNVLFVYLNVKPMVRFKERIYPSLKKGAKIISNTFEIPGLVPETIENGVYLYIKR